MKAIQINQYGDSSVLEINEVPTPTPGKGQILVKTHASSINPIDKVLRSGYAQQMMPLTFPATLGGDFSGEIIGLGEGVSNFKVGDEVYGQAILLNGGSGAFAEFIIANTGNTALKPKLVSYDEAAALPLAGVSALQAIEDHIKLQSGQKIFINGGAGGIGSYAIQLAKLKGAYVATTIRKENEAFVKELGADEVVDYISQNFEEILKEYDAVLDLAGGEPLIKAYQILKKGGVLVTLAGQVDQEKANELGITALGQMTNTNTEHLEHLAKHVEAGEIKVNVEKAFSLDEIKEAFDFQETGHPKGKVVIKVL